MNIHGNARSTLLGRVRPVRRSERARPGKMIHLYIMKLDRCDTAAFRRLIC